MTMKRNRTFFTLPVSPTLYCDLLVKIVVWRRLDPNRNDIFSQFWVLFEKVYGIWHLVRPNFSQHAFFFGTKGKKPPWPDYTFWGSCCGRVHDVPSRGGGETFEMFSCKKHPKKFSYQFRSYIFWGPCCGRD